MNYDYLNSYADLPITNVIDACVKTIDCYERTSKRKKKEKLESLRKEKTLFGNLKYSYKKFPTDEDLVSYIYKDKYSDNFEDYMFFEFTIGNYDNWKNEVQKLLNLATATSDEFIKITAKDFTLISKFYKKD